MALRAMTAVEVQAAYARGLRDFSDVFLHGANFIGTIHDHVRLVDASLDGAIFDHVYLADAHLAGASLAGARFVGANLDGARFVGANLIGARLDHASLVGANLDGARLDHASLDGARLDRASLVGASLVGASLDHASVGLAVFANVDLSSLCDATTIVHLAPSRIDWSTVARSYRHPRLKQFMIDCGVPALVAEYMIDCVRALGEVNIRAMLQSTFISYGGPDEPFARKLYEALRAAGVVTFFFPETAKLGERLHREMYRGVNEYDRILLVCSRASLTRPGVLNEIEETFAREAKQGGATYLLPITLDDFVFTDWKKSHEHLAERVLQRVVADFRGADTDDAKFQAALARAIDALKVKPVPSSLPPVGAGAGGGTP